jgi:hypothetical protein
LRLLMGMYYMATCSNQPIHARRFSELSVPGDLVREIRANIPGFYMDEYFEDIRLSENLFEHFVPTVNKENTDDYPILEFMLVQNYQLGRMGSDLFFEQQDLLNIDAVRQQEMVDAVRLVRRAGVFCRFNPYYFERNFLPALRRDPDTWASWVAWQAKYPP